MYEEVTPAELSAAQAALNSGGNPVRPAEPDQQQPPGLAESVNAALLRGDNYYEANPDQLVDYLKTVKVTGASIKGVSVAIVDDQLSVIGAAGVLGGEAQFVALYENGSAGLSTVAPPDINLPFFLRGMRGKVQQTFTNLDSVIKEQVNGQIDPEYEVDSVRIVNGKLAFTFKRKEDQATAAVQTDAVVDNSRVEPATPAPADIEPPLNAEAAYDRFGLTINQVAKQRLRGTLDVLRDGAVRNQITGKLNRDHFREMANASGTFSKEVEDDIVRDMLGSFAEMIVNASLDASDPDIDQLEALLDDDLFAEVMEKIAEKYEAESGGRHT